MVLRGKWQVDDGPAVNYARLWAREFQYDSPRQRYLAREPDPTPTAQNPG